jgi:hypothetical protein
MSDPNGAPQDIDEPTQPTPGAGGGGGDHDDNAGDEVAPDGITDDQLPEDLRPGDDNPLARPLDEEDAKDVDLGIDEFREKSESDGDSDDTED